MKKFSIILILLVFALQVRAQEFICNVQVSAPTENGPIST